MKTVLHACVVFVLAVAVEVLCEEPVLPCSPCYNVTCGDPPESCELDKIPCGCCPTCVRLEGQLCEAFSPRCGYGLKCLTPGGFYDGRPPWYMQYLRGVCVKGPQTHPDAIINTGNTSVVRAADTDDNV
ncbi:insulin-like growth factor-binding protein 5 [Ylistrum balloti]|uniref:insulin-like growth factor-binding protein 5 n=1 Tax=Ylistrum balloti TaxID=509963 RepID=UPI002905CCD8|nr:insulin-like growth factor-binding protein 5 [Ylistrum balloti]